MSVRCQQATKEHGVLKQTGLVCLWCLGSCFSWASLCGPCWERGALGLGKGSKERKKEAP